MASEKKTVTPEVNSLLGAYLMRDINFYYQQLEKISGIKLTQREIDIISFIISGRTAKKIASTLKLSPKTVENYTRSIMQKIGCNSQDGVRDFVEKSDHFLTFRNLNQFIFQKIGFDEWIQKNKHHIEKYQHVFFIVNKNENHPAHLINTISNFLTFIGFKILNGQRDAWNLLCDTDLQNIDGLIYCLPSSLVYNGTEKEAINKLCNYIKKIKISPNCVISFNSESMSPSSPILEKSFYLNADKDLHNYQIFYILLKNLIPELDIENSLSYLYEKNSQPSTINFSQNSVVPITQTTFLVILKTLFKKAKSKSLYFCGAFLLVFGLSAFFLKEKTSPFTIRSDLIIPNEKFLLQRPNIIKQIREKSKSKNSIQTIALVGVIGIGGAGKTTLARYYGKLSNTPIVWEINAENKESLMNSFKSLAYCLATTKETRDQLMFIQYIQDAEEKEKQLLFFVQNQLKQHNNWLLIYDNVNFFPGFKKFFPQESKIWGYGNIIITTRDSNLVNTDYIPSENIIQIEQLTEEEALTLFCKILYQKNPRSLSHKDQKEIREFLKQIPHFPLDISIAAYYIKSTSIGLDQYTDLIMKNDDAFDAKQKNLIEEISNYTQTRYRLINLSISELIKESPHYQELLFLICLLDSQNIPLDFLYHVKDSTTIDHLICDLKKYSLITSQLTLDSKNSFNSISLHRSMQTLSKAFLINKLTQEEREKLIEKFATESKSFFKKNIEGNYKKIYFMIPHFKSLIKNCHEFSSLQKDCIEHVQDFLYVLSYAYLKCSGEFLLAKEHFIKTYNLQNETQHLSSIELTFLLKALSDTCIALRDNDDAIFYAKKSIEYSNHIPEIYALTAKTLAAKSLRNIGSAYTHKNDFHNANQSFQQALKKVSEIDLPLRKDVESSIYKNLGYLYSSLNVKGDQANQGLEYLKNALELVDGNILYHLNPKKNLSCKIMQYKVSMGEACCRLGKYEEAFTQYFKDAQYIVDEALDHCSHFLSKIFMAIGIGEIYLRQNQLNSAKVKLEESVKVCEKTMGKDSHLTLLPKVFLLETKIRLNQLEEAYNNYLSILKIDQKSNTNYSNLIFISAHYHAFIIKLKQNDLKSARIHFKSFIEKIKPLCETILEKNKYEALANSKNFDVSDSLSNDIKNCLTQSTNIFTAIYGIEHSFVKEYVFMNNEFQ